MGFQTAWVLLLLWAGGRGTRLDCTNFCGLFKRVVDIIVRTSPCSKTIVQIDQPKSHIKHH